ncbi:MAG TPA: polyribonucleotide nucleotidyltransferase [Oligoflexia bacterium]|nr:polyribonucleotide nucleotidyltransferase [Oligoflexia bacterium]HMP48741.1 polyribonucleotide nucleotidyltransferase [Oligoflexia bacterium]
MESLKPEAKKTVELDFNGKKISLETGWWAKQADGAVIMRQGDTMVMATVCSAPARPGADFFPLVVDYQEKFYAAGRIPGGYFRREARPSETEILVCRLTDRPIRPLFPDGYMDEVQIIVNVLSSDGVNDPDVLSVSAASAALHVSSLPFQGPVAAVRVGRVDGKFIANPTKEEIEKSDLNFVVAAKKEALVMVEGGADGLSESEVIDALYFAHEEAKKIIALQDELRSQIGKPKTDFVPPETDSGLVEKVHGLIGDKIKNALSIRGKHERSDALKAAKEEILNALIAENEEYYTPLSATIKSIFSDAMKLAARRMIVNERVRLDGRGPTDVRPIHTETNVLPRAHGSAVFTRGETQVMSVVTLGTSMDAQRIETLMNKPDKTFMLHYNFPPFSTGEAKMQRGTSRREVGHGALAERAVAKILPSEADFPYTIRIVAETFESNGSSSMASVCSASLALMSAGVPTKAAVGGVAMGLINEDGKFEVITDILGDEDHFGDMDFKVCGTSDGITALQMDIKCDGLTREVMEKALSQAKAGRLHILGEMAKTISKPNESMSEHAPRITTIRIKPEKIREIIGPGGKVIQGITAATGVKIDISDDGTVKIASSDETSTKKALSMINSIVEEAEVGKVYDGVVKRIAEFGAFVEILPGTDGLVHVSQLSDEHVRDVRDVVSEGDQIRVKVIDIDRQGRIRLSRKEVLEGE